MMTTILTIHVPSTPGRAWNMLVALQAGNIVARYAKLLVVAALVVLLFGTKKLRTLGGDLGAAIKGFKKAMNDDDAAAKKGADVDLQAEKLSHKE